jgi:chromatin segregation and condensation protein Rec8/ScpA/Scc1 (kleisin family)
VSQTDMAEELAPEREARRILTVREQVLDLLLEKVEADRYPSSTMLDDIERILTPWRREDYADVLLEKIRRDKYPSRSMIERVLRLSG